MGSAALAATVPYLGKTTRISRKGKWRIKSKDSSRTSSQSGSNQLYCLYIIVAYQSVDGIDCL